jgi:hypothetical protein
VKNVKRDQSTFESAHRILGALRATAVLALVAMSARADFLGVTWTGDAVLIHQGSNTFTTIGPTSALNLNSMAKDAQGHFITANEGGGTPKLYRVDPVVGKALFFHFPFLNDIRAMSSDPGGVLYSIDALSSGVDDRLYTLDLSVPPGDSIIAHFVGQIDINGIQDMAFASDGTLYGWSIGAGLITIDPVTAHAVDVNGLLDGTDQIQSLAFAPDGTLYGAGDNLYVIDRVTGNYSQVGTGSVGSVRGMAYIDSDATVAYCHAKPNSLDCLPSISSTGTASLSGPDDFFIDAQNIVNHKNGLLIWSLHAQDVPFQGGDLCLGAPLFRTPAQNSGGNTGVPDCSGTFQYHFSQSYMLLHGLNAGSHVHAQYYYRDLLHPDGTGVGLSDALRFSIGG